MKFSRWVLAGSSLFALATVVVSQVHAQEATGPQIKAGAMEVTLSGKAQTQFSTTSVESEQPSDLQLRRITLQMAIQANKFVSGVAGVGFAGNKVTLKDAYLKLAFSPALQLLAGNAKLPFSRLELTSLTRMPSIERGASIRGISPLEEQNLLSGYDYSGRDVGIQVLGAPAGAPLGLQYSAGIFSGPLSGEVGPQNSYQYAARLEISPLTNVSAAAGWSNRDFAAPEGGDLPELRRGSAFEADIEYGSYQPGLHVLAQAASGTADPFSGDDFSGVAAWVAYRTMPLSEMISGLEPSFRASYGDVDGALSARGGTLLTPGVNFYFGGLNRVMFNYDYWSASGAGADQHSVKVMFQMAF